MVEDSLGKLLGLRVGQVGAEPLGIQAHLVHANEADGGEMVGKGAKVPLGVGIEPGVQQFGNDGALGLETPSGDVHKPVQAPIKVGLVLGEIGDAGQVDGHHAHEPVDSPEPKKPPDFFRSSLRSRRRRQHILRTSLGSMSELM